MGFDIGHWLGQAAKSVGRPVGDAAKAIDKPFSAVTHATGIDQTVKFLGHPISQGINAAGQAGQKGFDLIGQIPVVGRPLEAIYDIQLKPFEIAAQIASGRNVSQTALRGLKETVSDARTAAPLVQSVIAVIPAIGPVASGMISAGLAIAEGEPIDSVIEAGLVGSIPGGAVAASAYNLGKAVVQGKANNPAAMVSAVLSSAANAAGIQLPHGTAGLIAAGVGTTAALAKGEKPDQALIQNAMPALGAVGPQVQQLLNQGHLEDAANKIMSAIPGALKTLPKSVGDAIGQGLRVGSMVGIAQQLQSSMKSALSSKMLQLAIPAATLTPSELALMNSLPADERTGFAIGINVKNTKASKFQIAAVRQLLNNSREQDGYDAAISMGIGQVTATPPHAMPPLAKAGYLIHKGVAPHSDPQHTRNIVAILPPSALHGVAVSAAETSLGGVKIIGGVAVGGFAGFKVAGPVGTVIGAVLGGLLGHRL